MANAKTMRKRIALVAAGALGIGVLAAAPAFAALATSVAVVTATSNTLYTTVGTAATTSVLVATTTAETNAGALVITPTISSSPTGATIAVGAPGSGKVGLGTPVASTNVALAAAANVWTNSVAAGVESLTWSSGTIPAFSATAVSTFSLTATMPGDYVVVLTPAGATTTNTPTTITVHVSGVAYKTGDGAAVDPASTGNGIAGPANTVTVVAVTSAAGRRALVTVSGAGATISTGGTVATGGLSTVIAADNATSQAVVIGTPTAGTVTVSEFYETGSATGIYSATADSTVTITVNAAAVTGTVSVAKTVTTLNDTTGTAVTGTDATGVAHSSAIDNVNPAANITVVINDATGTNITTKAITATISGPGFLSAGNAAASSATALGRAVTSSVVGGTQHVSVFSDGTSGVSTITLSVGSTILGTKTVTFYGAVTSVTLTSDFKAISADGGAVANTLLVVSKDAVGTVVPSQASTFTSSDTAILGSGSATSATSAQATTGTGITSVTPVGSKYGTVTVTAKDTTSGVVSAAVTIVVSKPKLASITVTASATSFAPGATVTLTVSAKDVNGLPMPDGTLAADTVSANMSAIGFDIAGTTFALVNGTATKAFYAPVVAGSFSGTLKYSTNIDSSITAGSFSVPVALTVAVAPDPAIAAAKAAADAATAAVATLSITLASLVASITAQIKALSALIKKIMTKLKIK